MTAVLLDTHAWVWSFADDRLLSDRARQAIAGADAVFVSPISFFEIGQKVRIGKWPEMEPLVDDLPRILLDQGGLAAPLTPQICLRAATWDWAHRDPFDRLIAATAAEADLTLVSIDTAFIPLHGIRMLW
ncbi:type II toxin-antitoxin system VapC family toxin [Tateyamaria omphalii]|uniref:type II toxin-antitoxin system VapC family toxin n=1 Tax=Tateyamaria omphalii TaxID=299262 RepID=UPI001C98E6DE|nr:type II toxin-antitoxin system VapC family toxin [Tateyamaria omphalii]MBY5935448.1 type II toxin-antitoxin system VapC family toxin [Tateyamaria omphalii]